MTRDRSRLLPVTPLKPRYRVLVDADILLEFIYHREKFIEEVEFLLRKAKQIDYVDFFITDQSLKRIRTATNDIQPALDTIDYFRSLLGQRQIIRVDEFIVAQARTLDIVDIDSAIEHTCATEYGLDAIVTQNPSNFKNANISIWAIPSLEKRVSLEDALSEPSVVWEELTVTEDDMSKTFRTKKRVTVEHHSGQLYRETHAAVATPCEQYLAYVYCIKTLNYLQNKEKDLPASVA